MCEYDLFRHGNARLIQVIVLTLNANLLICFIAKTNGTSLYSYHSTPFAASAVSLLELKSSERQYKASFSSTLASSGIREAKKL